MQILFFSLLVGFCCGLIGAIYRSVLAYELILNWWFRFGNRYEGKWFFRPVWECAKCFSGQLAGWFWLAFKILPAIIRYCGQISRGLPFSIHYAQTGAALILGWFCAICAAIFTAIILQSFLTDKN